MIENSIKQMIRMKVQAFYFFLFMVLTGGFLALSSNLLVQNTGNIKNFEGQFTTIGTVEQKASSISQSLVWDAKRKDYIIRQSPEYKQIYLPDSLLFKGADYIQEPEKRNYYGSYGPEYKLSNEGCRYDQATLVVEFSPEEDCIPNETIKINIKSVLSGQPPGEAWFCAHNDKEPEPLFKDKTYIAYLSYWQSNIHGSHVPEGQMEPEYVPVAPYAVQYNSDGQLIKEESLKTYYEVTKGFYETEIGKRYLNLASGNGMLKDTFPVTGTNSTNLLMAFYSGDAYVVEGEDISRKEYEEGQEVCLVSEKFAEQNHLKVGDFVKTRLYYTNGKLAAVNNFSMDGEGFNYNILKAEGGIPEIFEETEYRIKGLYFVTSGGKSGEYGIARDEMIVPSRSIKKPNECNILAYGPMRANTSSFQIPNGKIEEFMEKWNEIGNNDLKITFYDKGYTQLKKGLDNMKIVSFVLGITAVVMGVSFLLFYIHLFLSTQKSRMAMERCMGLSKRKCIMSMASGILLVFLLGTAIGGIGGAALSQNISVDTFQREYYDTTYSNGWVREIENRSIRKTEWEKTVCISTVCVGGYILLGSFLLVRSIKKELEKEPLQLLNEITDNL